MFLNHFVRAIGYRLPQVHTFACSEKKRPKEKERDHFKELEGSDLGTRHEAESAAWG